VVGRFAVVSIWVENERRIVAWMVRMFARAAVVPATRRNGCSKELIDLALVSRLKREMDPRDWSVRHVHPKLIGGEVVGAFRYGVQATQRGKHSLVEPLAGDLSHADVCGLSACHNGAPWPLRCG